MKAMKTKNMFWAALSMTAALVMTACSSDNDITETPAAPQPQKTIPYTVTVTDDAATTRATVSDDPTDRQLYFAEGDQLYITGENIQGVLDLQAGDEGKASGATFSGELTYTGSGAPADDLELAATLVSAQQESTNKISVDATTGAVTVNYPTAAYCADVATAVQEYSRLTGTSTYGAKAFSLTQQTAFLNFEITFEDGTTAKTPLTAVVSNNSATVCTADVTTEIVSEKVVAKFVLPVAAGTTLSSATVTMGDNEAISFGASQELAGKVYNVKKTQAASANKTLKTATTADYGKVVCADGHLHDAKTAVPDGCTAVGILSKVTTKGHGLILALKDATSQTWYTINDWTSVTTYAGTTLKQLPDDAARGSLTSYTTLGETTVSNWCVAQKDDYSAIFQNLGTAKQDVWYGGYLCDNYVNAFITTGVGGTSLSGYYWTATEHNSEKAYRTGTDAGDYYSKSKEYKVRPVIGF